MLHRQHLRLNDAFNHSSLRQKTVASSVHVSTFVLKAQIEDRGYQLEADLKGASKVSQLIKRAAVASHVGDSKKLPLNEDLESDPTLPLRFSNERAREHEMKSFGREEDRTEFRVRPMYQRDVERADFRRSTRSCSPLTSKDYNTRYGNDTGKMGRVSAENRVTAQARKYSEEKYNIRERQTTGQVRKSSQDSTFKSREGSEVWRGGQGTDAWSRDKQGTDAWSRDKQGTDGWTDRQGNDAWRGRQGSDYGWRDKLRPVTPRSSSPWNSPNRVWNSRMITSSIQNTENEEGLHEIAKQHGEQFDFINACACMVKLAKMVVAASSSSSSALSLTVVPNFTDLRSGVVPAGSNEEQSNSGPSADSSTTESLIRLLLMKLNSFVEALRPRELANMVWALGKLSGTYPLPEFKPMLVTLLEKAKPQLSDFKSQELSNIAYSCARLSYLDHDFFEVLESVCLQSLDRNKREQLASSRERQSFSHSTDNHSSVRMNTGAITPSFTQDKDTLSKPEWNNQELANVMWSLATLNRYNETLFTALCQSMYPRLNTFKSSDVVTVIWSMANTGHQDPKFATQLMRRGSAIMSRMSNGELSMLAQSLPRIKLINTDIDDVLFGNSGRENGKNKATGSAMGILDALATNIDAEALMYLRKVVSELRLRIQVDLQDTITPSDLMNAIWAATLLIFLENEHKAEESYSVSDEYGSSQRQFFDSLVQVAWNMLPAFKPHELIQLVWSCAKVEYTEQTELVHALCEWSINRILSITQGRPQDYLRPGDLGRLIWALARLGYAGGDDEVCGGGSNHGLTTTTAFSLNSKEAALIPSKNAQPAAACQGGVAVRHPNAPGLLPVQSDDYSVLGSLEDLVVAFLPQLPSFTSVELSNMLWGMSMMPSIFEAKRDIIIAAVTDSLRSMINILEAKEVANALVALARLDHCDPSLLNDLIAISLKRLHAFRSQELANLCWSLGKLRFKDELLMAAVTQRILRQTEDVIEMGIMCTSGQSKYNISPDEEMSHNHTAGSSSSLMSPSLREPSLMSPSLREPSNQSQNALLVEEGGDSNRGSSRSHEEEMQQQQQEEEGRSWVSGSSNSGLMASSRLASSSGPPPPRRMMLSCQEASNIVTAFALLGCGTPELYCRIGSLFACRRLRSSVNRQDLANLAHAFSIAQVFSPWLISSIVSSTNKLIQWQNMHPESQEVLQLELCQLLQYFLVIEEEGLVPQQYRTKEQYKRVRQLVVEAGRQNKEKFYISVTQTAVLRVLKQIPGFEHASMEYATEDGLMCMDIAVPVVSFKQQAYGGTEKNNCGEEGSERPADVNLDAAEEAVPLKRKRGRPPGKSGSKAKGSLIMLAEAGSAVAEPQQKTLCSQVIKNQVTPSRRQKEPVVPLLGTVPFRGIAIEVDGPTHFLNSHPDESDGTSKLRNRLLMARGWFVMVVPAHAFYIADGGGNGKTYLLQLLERSGAASWLAKSQQF
ncbi:hypothetical protein CEUSTIGMA_g9325.t1 [Chlamydomonas eustigma]|uniref:Uncharacterized protein n=1 Tax=Chlamydomonas eustigma TaxID=1157962 RepID=A0A250XFQ3_9CHLO|nr:hypothetical protein CEUSTIGMA_g9325.t1 [Chlamydomonas eustigma]|eukprot:GAX81897.1 hypothetical protein CEUSTIGMA_g9325.t1 [Chlamydomonas eustigma]